MRSNLNPQGLRTKAIIFALIISVLLLTVQACGKKKTPIPPTAAPTLTAPTPTPQPLPPALVETDPLPGAQIALQNPITFYFNQPMDRYSVEGAISGQPGLSGRFTWKDDASLTFTPDTPFAPGSAIAVNIAASAKSAKGMAMLRPVSLSYRTSDYLSLTQSLPADNAAEVNPTSAIVAAFNQPVVALGADSSSLPAAFTLAPAAQGQGEWLNTSTYIFYPQPALAGGTAYLVRTNPDLTSTSGSPLLSAPQWAFTTVMPRLVNAEPLDGAPAVSLDATVKLNFSYSMDADSVTANFSVQNEAGDAVSGQSAWNEDFTTFVFTPTSLLQRGETYTTLLDADAAALGGTRLGESYQQSWSTVGELAIVESLPSEGGVKPNYESIGLFLTSFVDAGGATEYVTFEPSVPNLGAWTDRERLILYFYGSFEPDTDYTLTVSPDLTDLWGSRLGDTYTLNFRTSPLDPSLTFPYSSDATFLTTQDPGIMAQVTNLSAIPISIGTLTIDDLVQMYAENGWTYRESFVPDDAQYWTFYPDAPHNRSTTVTLPVTPGGEARLPGLYFMRFDIPNNYGQTLILAVSRYQATLKLTRSKAFIWAVDLETNAPAGNLPVTVYDQKGTLLASGTTDANGIFQGDITAEQSPYGTSFAMLGTQGEDDFGMVWSSWSDGISPWDFDVNANYYPAKLQAYVYTDRPIYRPGDTVYYRLVVRSVSNGRYSLPDIGSYAMTLNGPLGEVLATFDLPLSGFGTASGEYTLPSDAQPGSYSLLNPDTYDGLYFAVADYRKPDINLQVEFQSTQVISGSELVADVNARYFFDAPAGNMPLKWVLYRLPEDFSLPNYQVGPVDTGWLDVFHYPFFGVGLGDYVDEGSGQTDPNGLFTVHVSPPAEPGRQKYTLEVTLTDESGLPVSARSTVYANPAEYYIGIRPDAWSYQAKSKAGFEVLTVDLDGNPSGGHSLEAEFQRVEWVRSDPDPADSSFYGPSYKAEYTPVESQTVTTGSDGKARLAFTPPEPGTYQIDVSGDGTLTQVIVWVGGQGQTVWPALPNQRLRLVTDKDKYQPGDTAQVFVPNPFGSPAKGLLTVERGEVMRYQLFELQPGGDTVPVELGNDDAPNVVVAITLLGQDDQSNPDFRQGYVNLPVDPSFEYLNIELTSQPQRAGPGEAVNFSVRITDAAGNPVQGEFSLSVVDMAVLALADPNAKDIFSAFYGEQPLSVRTGISLAASGQRLRYMPGGMGGGGGDMEFVSVTRENFPDTAYWEAQVLTDANGEASASMNLPDSLTTWQVLVRGLTEDTLVGETQLEVVTTKELLIRPVTPRFLVVEDHAMLSAVAQNNTSSALQGTVTLQATGFTLDDAKSATQQVTIPANGGVRVEWWGTAEDTASASLRFSVQAGSLQDAVLVSRGALPILRYIAPQTFATSGTLAEGGERLELVSLPQSFDVNSGTLEVELDPSLAAAMVDALEALENYPYDSAEQILSRFLPNLVTYKTLQTFGLEAPDLQARLDRTLKEGLDHLLSLQRSDGGWGWWQGDESDPYVSAYVLYGLATARQAGISVPDEALEKATSYISSQLFMPGQATKAWELDRLAFENYALMKAGPGSVANANQLYAVRDQLSPWAKSFLALTLEAFDDSDQRVDALVSDLQATAIRSATGVHWEAKAPDWRNMTSTLSNSAMVLYALARLEPASTLIPDGVNFLMSNRNAKGCWSSSYESAWILLAMDEVMERTGELNSNYAFHASLNGTQVAAGEAGGATQLNPVTTSLPVSQLYPQDPNALLIEREAGNGRLYYTAALNVYRPAEEVAPLDRGISVNREYFAPGADLKTATPVEATQVGGMLTVRLTVVVPHDAYHIAIEDYIPAGAEILNTSLKTTQIGAESEVTPLYDPADPYSSGWYWWLFNAPQIYDDRISWTAAYLPAGTYQLTYTLVILQPGEYRVLPAHAWMFYFPEVQGNSAGGLLEIKP